MGRDSGEDEDLGTVVLDVVGNVVQRLQVLQCQHKLLGLGNKSNQYFAIFDLEFDLSLCSKYIWEQVKYNGDCGGEVCVTCVDDPQLASGFL